MEPQMQPRNNSRPQATLELRPEVKVRSVKDVYDNSILEDNVNNERNLLISIISILVVIVFFAAALFFYPPSLIVFIIELFLAIVLGGVMKCVFM